MIITKRRHRRLVYDYCRHRRLVYVDTTNYKQNIAIIESYLPHTSTTLNINIRMLTELLIYFIEVFIFFIFYITTAGFKQCQCKITLY